MQHATCNMQHVPLSAEEIPEEIIQNMNLTHLDECKPRVHACACAVVWDCIEATPPANCDARYATCNMRHATCNMQHATCGYAYTRRMCRAAGGPYGCCTGYPCCCGGYLLACCMLLHVACCMLHVSLACSYRGYPGC